MTGIKFNEVESFGFPYSYDGGDSQPPSFLSLELRKIEGKKITQDECEVIIRTDAIEIVQPLNMGDKRFYVIFFKDKKIESIIITQKQMESLKDIICEYKITLE